MFRLTTEAVRRLADAASFERGREYIREGRLYDAVAVDGFMRAMCVGSMEIDYSVQIRLGADRIEDARCTCPRGGFCKHLVALALLPEERPDDLLFIRREELRQTLSRHTKEELISIIIERVVSDVSFARRILATPASSEDDDVDGLDFPELIAEYRDQVDRAFMHASSNPYRDAVQSAAALKDILLEEEYAARHDPTRLLAFYVGMYVSIEEHAGWVDDSEGAVGAVAALCARGMADTLGSFEIGSETQCDWLRIVVPRYLKNDYGLGDDLDQAIARVRGAAPIALAEELILESVERERSNVDRSDWQRHYRLMTAGELLAELYVASSRDAEIPELYRDLGLDFHYVTHRLSTGDVAGAVAHARTHLRIGYDITRFARALLDAGELSAVRGFLEVVLPELGSNEPYRKEILQVYADTLEGLGDFAEALDVKIQSFRERPSVESFRRAIDAARALGRGAEVDRRMIEWAETGGVSGERLVEIHIDRGDVDAAVRAFRRTPAYHRDELTIRLAEFIANDRPEESRSLLESLVESNIARRNRAHYAQAATIAGKLRPILGHAAFTEYVRTLRARYPRLPALQDELNRAFDR